MANPFSATGEVFATKEARLRGLVVQFELIDLGHRPF
jgi:hypothetical protein